MASKVSTGPNLDHRAQMDEVTRGHQTKSDRIRALAKAGYGRAEIARHLEIRYQHVRNVLVDDEARASREGPSLQPLARSGEGAGSPGDANALDPAKSAVEQGGRVAIPPQFLAALALKQGDPVILSFEGDSIRLMSLPASVRRVQTMVRRLMPEGVNLVDELIAERRLEAKREDEND